MNRSRTVLGALVATVVLGAAPSGCGVPHDERATVIPDADLPRGLTVPDASPRATSSTAPAARADQVVWVHDDELVTSALAEYSGRAEDRVRDALTALLAGPTTADRARGYGTALAPDARVELQDLSAGTAYLDVDLGRAAPSADQLPIAIGQVVLTVTSVAGVRAVHLQHDGEAVSAPLPDGALEPGLVSRADYVALLG